MTLKLNGSSSGYTAIDAPATAGSNTLTLPTTNGSAGQVLTTDGNGNLSWKSPGIILQVVQGTLGSDKSITDTSWVDMGLDVSITPASASNKILVSLAFGTYMGGSDAERWGIGIDRDSTVISVNEYAVYRTASDMKGNTSSMVVLDSPNTTSAIQYSGRIKRFEGSQEFWMKAAHTNAYTITAMEIAA